MYFFKKAECKLCKLYTGFFEKQTLNKMPTLYW